MTMTAENEFHDLIAKLQAWFRAEAAASTLDALMDHFCTDFSMVGIAGQRLDREALAGMFAGGHGARPGLRIEIDALQFIAVPAPLVMLRYREGQGVAEGGMAWREALAVLRQEDGRWRWLALHEVTAA
ncbi:DUF4440 domain-containing protein [Stenotrophomonas geniculata]|jgi:hypothetical protein|uniref:Cytoplasmic protein n=2 Tax=Stenotrophomonas geniculata TaxID=86188 RepID=A0A0L8ABX6_9GAMM|nr:MULTISPECIES: DUF4440 domain-containing protein [Stenotrophomonas]MBN5132046.1 DUF4440 domain-containing protein [Stenotrophomonas maltophilia]KOE99903.1 cytoplasmic protein [Stenotrophomonas geniculata N1]MBN5134560.1 DUF4440 domain-containing protein [Stenotrophomonas maltophilia]MCF3475246.1 DUF4440 domain-containing protein [Stenotrophomonas maltophilia]MCI1052962.1 DUF4440 domain-containing protein [Stenotrophomonas maltophilia]